MSVGLQLFSLRDFFSDDARACVASIAKIGFPKVEGYDLIHLQSIMPYLRDHGIAVNSSFLLWSHITGRRDLAEKIGYPWLPAYWGIDHEIELAHKLNLKTLVCGYLLPEERACLDDFKRLADQLNTAGEACRMAGIQLLYHNHTFEFQEMDGQVPYAYLQSHTSAENLGFELDVLWAQLAGFSPIDVANDLGDRLKALHLKSGACADIPLWDEKTLPLEGHDYPLGAGDVDIASILELSQARGIEHLYIEQEYGASLLESLGDSFQFVRSILGEGAMAPCGSGIVAQGK